MPRLRIRELRVAKGLTQLQLALACGRKSKSTVCGWEDGTSAPPSKLLPTVAAALAVTIADLYEGPPADEAA